MPLDLEINKAMKYLGIYMQGTDNDRDVIAEVRGVLAIKCHCVLFKNEAECNAVYEEIKERLHHYTVEWLNGFYDPLDDDVVLSVSRGKILPHSIGTVHFFKCKRTFQPNVSAD